jgi:hypothetical protein
MSQKGKKQKTSYIKGTFYNEKVEFDFSSCYFAKIIYLLPKSAINNNVFILYIY